MKDKLTASMPRHFPEEMAEAKKIMNNNKIENNGHKEVITTQKLTEVITEQNITVLTKSSYMEVHC
jgi:hypothetical protein